VLKEQQGQKAEAAGVDKKIILILLLFSYPLTKQFAQQLPENETQVNFSGYFDNFDVSVIYPSISITKRLSGSTSLTGRYLVDMITAASIRNSSSSSSSTNSGGGEGDKSLSKVDAVTAASGTGSGGRRGGDFSLPSFDEVRHEFNFGLAQLIGGGILTADGIYSTESDYTSSTLIGNFTQYFAENNTSLQLGVVRRWDRVFPKTKDWTKNKNVVTLNANFSQIISKSLILQLLSSYTNNNGLLSDNYELVPISINGKDSLFDPIHPDLRIRRAAALSLKYRLTDKSSLQLGYRYYWDSWNVNANTYSVSYESYLSKHVILDVGVRSSFQTRASFFKPEYTAPERYMTSDIKLDAGNSNELQLELILKGGDRQNFLPFLKDDRVQYIFNLNFYARHTNSPYWYNNSSNLFATNINIGIRYRY
jgi:Protein of unknown function (DUF3570)